MIEVSNLTKIFKSEGGNVSAVNDISLTLEGGQFASIIGKSGSGKSTLLSLLGALDEPTRGSIVVDGKDVTKMHDRKLIKYRAKTIGFVFQGYNLIPNLSAIDNVLLALEFGGYKKSDRTKRAQSLLEKVGIDEAKQLRKPLRLSGGEQQRVAIARALANSPKLILADEPTGNLDSVNGQKVFELLHALARSENTTVVVVTHDTALAGKTDKTFELKDGKLLIVS